MVFQTLEKVSTKDLVIAFNTAFKDYFVSFVLTEQQMINKFRLEDFAPEYSVAAISKGQIVGFILHSFREVEQQRLIYNGGTGVVASYRGQGLTQQMYAFIKPKLQAAQIDKCILEVIDKNEPAKRSYEKIGFNKVKTLTCWKQQKNSFQEKLGINLKVKKVKEPEWDNLSLFGHGQTTWTNNIYSIQNDFVHQTFLSIYAEEKWVAFGIVNGLSGRIAQIGVLPHYRSKGIGSYLLHELGKLSKKTLSIINVDQEESGFITFLKANNFINTINQYEMNMLFD